MYATLAQMVTLYGAPDLALLTGHDEGTVELEERVEAVCQQAQDEVDGYLVDVATLPLAEERVPGGLRLHACRVAYYHLHRNGATEKAKDDYDASIRFLERVQSGRGSLGLSPSGEVPAEPLSSVSSIVADPGTLSQGADRFLR